MSNLDPDPAELLGQDNEVVRLENVSVRYRLPNLKTRSLKEFAIQTLKGNVNYREHWALRNINLSVQKGEILGLIGHNGAGKSTLLKVVARIMRPTQGRVVVKGDTAALLGVGAGFHMELTGRENIYLNGTLLGFTQKEMDEKAERIIDFAELWDYIDQPLRTYSSGMRARLGFAVATDTKPDVLIVDEILAVGDEAFRTKSAERMEEFREGGTTILIVSHNLGTLHDICHKIAWIHKGELRMYGDTDELVGAYIQERKSHLAKKNPKTRA